jgi:tetratricopeptide (TPR) repeat protein
VREALDFGRSRRAAAGTEPRRIGAGAGDPRRDTASSGRRRSEAPSRPSRTGRLREAGLGKDSEAAYQRALEVEPGSVAARVGLALALAAQGKAEAALEAARAAAQADPASAEAQAAVGLVALARDPLDKTGEAVAAVQQASFQDPKSALAKLAVGRVFESRGQLPQAAAAFEQAAGLDPTWGAPRIGALRIALREGDAAAALARLRALPHELKTSGEADLLLGELLARTGDPIGARAVLDGAAAALPGRAEVHAVHGAAAYDAGELTLAADALGRAVALDPGNLDYRHRHALLLAYDGRLDEALAALLEVTRRPEGQTAGSFVDLGWLYRTFKPPRVAESVAAYERALKLDPRSAEAALGVALAYRAGKQWTRAADAYERLPTVNRRLEGEAMLGAAWCFYRGGDDYRARFYTGLAARAAPTCVGCARPSPALPRAPVTSSRARRRLLDSKSAGDQVLAVRALVELGRPAVPSLAAALARPATSLAAREAIVAGFGGMGPAAREALPQLDRLIKAGPPGAGPPGSPAEKERQEREAKLIGAMESGAARIRGR